MPDKPGITVIIPCLNEEGNLTGSVSSVKEALSSLAFTDYEIIIFNDGSTDGTGRLADEIKMGDRRITVVHNPVNMGFGYNYTEGVRLASKEFTIMVPGDNEIPAGAIGRVLSLVGRADIVIPYTANAGSRALSRRVVSRLFVAVMNGLFGLRLKYYNGTCLIRTALLKTVPMRTRGFAYMAAILVRLIRSGASFVETGVDIRPRENGASKAFRPKNVLSVFSSVACLFWDVRIRGLCRGAEDRAGRAMGGLKP